MSVERIVERSAPTEPRHRYRSGSRTVYDVVTIERRCRVVKPITVELPTDVPQLTPRAAAALLQLLRDASTRGRTTERPSHTRPLAA